jgi:hypothetical protein
VGGSYTRRDFIVRSGILGAAIAIGWVPGAALPPALAQTADDLPLSDIGGLLRMLARDTFDGFASMVVPGPDAYSVAQGVTAVGPGAIDAGVSTLLMNTFDHFIALPDLALANVAVALSAGLAAPPLSLPPTLAKVATPVTNQLDDALRKFTENDQAIPVSVVLALVLDQAAIAVNPAAVSGPFVSPFARLSFDEKLAAMELLETASADVVGTIDGQLPDSETGSASGLIRFTTNAIFAVAGFGAYAEQAVFNPVARRLTGRPVGWSATGYQPNGPVAGWAEFQGYFRGHRSETT